MLNGALWTVTAMLIIQVCIWILAKLNFACKEKYQYTVIFAIGVIIYIIVTLLRGRRGAWEMQSCFAFVLGVFFVEAEEQIRIIIKRTSSTFTFLVLFNVTFIAPYLFEVLFCDLFL